jgi:hypothetical protein
LELQTLLDCVYRNASDRMVILRCCGPHAFFLERVVFPFELLSFQCPNDSEVEIWTHGLGGPELLESCPARELGCEPTAALGEAGALQELETANPWLEAS